MGRWTTPDLNFSSGIQVVTFFTVLGKVEAGVLILSGNSKADGLVDKQQQDDRAGGGKNPGDRNAGCLVQHLSPVAVDCAGGRTGPKGRIDGPCCEEARKQCAECSAGTVHAKRIKGVVVAEPVFDFEDHERAEDAGNEANEQSGKWLDKPGGWRDRDKPGDCSRDGAEGCRFAVVDPFGNCPAKGGSGGREMSIDK